MLIINDSEEYRKFVSMSKEELITIIDSLLYLVEKR